MQATVGDGETEQHEPGPVAAAGEPKNWINIK